MKQKRPPRAERRRPLVEINLIAEPKARTARMRRQGCALFASSAAIFAASAAAFLGLR